MGRDEAQLIVRTASNRDLAAVVSLIIGVGRARVDISVARSRAGTAIRNGCNRKNPDICLVAERNGKITGWLYAQEIMPFDLLTTMRWYYVPFLIGEAKALLGGLRKRTHRRAMVLCYDDINPKKAAMRRLMEASGFRDEGTIWMG